MDCIYSDPKFVSYCLALWAWIDRSKNSAIANPTDENTNYAFSSGHRHNPTFCMSTATFTTKLGWGIGARHDADSGLIKAQCSNADLADALKSLLPCALSNLGIACHGQTGTVGYFAASALASLSRSRLGTAEFFFLVSSAFCL
jgi:hypothetical protein